MRLRRLALPAVAVALLASSAAIPVAATGPRRAAGTPQAAPVPPSRALVGEWSPVFKMPTLPAHMALLPNGKVLMWLAGRTTNAYVWDPATRTSVKKPVRANLMCAGFVHLSDGRLFVAGGQGAAGGSQGLRTTYMFDWETNTWTAGPTMEARRWYASVAALPNGEALILGGGPLVPEVLQTDGTLRKLTTAPLALTKRYPFIQVGSHGEVGFFGHQSMLRLLDPSGTGAWTESGARDSIERVYASYAMFDIDKVLVAGGGPTGTYPTASAVVVESDGDSLVATPTGSLATGRRQGHLTILADGTVLYSGGQNSKGEQVSVKKPVRTPERWDPQTGLWTSMAPSKRSRQYHSSALLLPDGRVLTSGGGACAGCGKPVYDERNAEIYSPPYLFAADGSPATRPVIDSFPSVAVPGGSYAVQVTSGSGVSKMALVRLGADTHAVDQGQRYVPVAVTPVDASNYQITLPASYGALPPGYYMLFALDGEGVPSVAQMVKVQ